MRAGRGGCGEDQIHVSRSGEKGEDGEYDVQSFRFVKHWFSIVFQKWVSRAFALAL